MALFPFTFMYTTLEFVWKTASDDAGHKTPVYWLAWMTHMVIDPSSVWQKNNIYFCNLTLKSYIIFSL